LELARFPWWGLRVSQPGRCSRTPELPCLTPNPVLCSMSIDVPGSPPASIMMLPCPSGTYDLGYCGELPGRVRRAACVALLLLSLRRRVPASAFLQLPDPTTHTCPRVPPSHQSQCRAAPLACTPRETRAQRAPTPAASARQPPRARAASLALACRRVEPVVSALLELVACAWYLLAP
jgi:hypothetical protein